MWWQTLNNQSYKNEMQQTCTEGVQNHARLLGEVVLLGIEQDIKIWPFYQLVYAQSRICPEEWDA